MSGYHLLVLPKRRLRNRPLSNRSPAKEGGSLWNALLFVLVVIAATLVTSR